MQLLRIALSLPKRQDKGVCAQENCESIDAASWTTALEAVKEMNEQENSHTDHADELPTEVRQANRQDLDRLLVSREYVNSAVMSSVPRAAAPGTFPPSYKKAVTAKALQIGGVLKDRFILEEYIGAGGMGVVFKAKDLRRVEAKDRNPYVAVKVLAEYLRANPETWIVLQREARKAQTLAHPNIITVFDFDQDADVGFITMELLEGESLSAILERVRGTGLKMAEALPLIKGMGEALAYAHRNRIVHSDLKPGNVFVTREGVVKILDFGVARAMRRPGDTTVFDPSALGALTPAYATCEAIEGGPPDPRDDIYALACISYELLSGEHPFHRFTGMQARALDLKPKEIVGLSYTQQRALQRGLALDRTRRTPSVEAFLSELEQLETRKGYISKNWPYLLLVGVIILVGSGSYMMVPHIVDYIKRQHVDKHFAELTTLLDARQWTPERLSTGASLLQQIAENAPRDVRIENARDTLASGYAELARRALAEGKWDTAENLVAAAKALTPGNRMGVELGNISAAIRNTRLQQQEILSLERRLEESLASMEPTGPAAKEVLEMVRELSSLDPQHRGLEEKRNQVADKLAVAATELGQVGNWLAGIALVNESLVLLPDSMVLARTKAELEHSYAGKLSEDRRLKEEAQRRADAPRQARSPKQVTVKPPVPPKPVPEAPEKPAEQPPDGVMTTGDEGAKKGVEVPKQAETAKPAKPLELPEIELISPLSPPTVQEPPAQPKPAPDAAERPAGQQPPGVITSGEGGTPKKADAPKETQPAKQATERKPPASPKPVPKVPEKPAGQQPPWTIVPGGT